MAAKAGCGQGLDGGRLPPFAGGEHARGGCGSCERVPAVDSSRLSSTRFSDVDGDEHEVLYPQAMASRSFGDGTPETARIQAALRGRLARQKSKQLADIKLPRMTGAGRVTASLAAGEELIEIGAVLRKAEMHSSTRVQAQVRGKLTRQKSAELRDMQLASLLR